MWEESVRRKISVWLVCLGVIRKCVHCGGIDCSVGILMCLEARLYSAVCVALVAGRLCSSTEESVRAGKEKKTKQTNIRRLKINVPRVRNRTWVLRVVKPTSNLWCHFDTVETVYILDFDSRCMGKSFAFYSPFS